MDRSFDDPAILEASRKEDFIVISDRLAIAVRGMSFPSVGRSELWTG